MSNRWLSLRLLVAVTALLTAASLAANSTPTVTADVNVANGIKTYTYTLTNNYSAADITVFDLIMPPAGADGVIDITSSQAQGNPAWFAEKNGSYTWTMGGFNVSGDETIYFWLTTADDVPTVYDYIVDGGVGNWSIGLWSMGDDGRGHGWSESGNTSLPVPSGAVPEPSGLLAFLTGLGGLGGVLLKRRK